jgi:hypothetical protein
MTIYKTNKYSRWYNNIIEKAKRRSILRSYFDGENHHILPKSLGGSDNLENIAKLTYREHYVCHLLLTKMCVDKQHEIKMCWALHRLTFSRTYYGSHQYEIARKIHIKNITENHPSKTDPNYGEKISERVYKDWENNQERKDKFKKSMKEWHKKNPERSRKISIDNLPPPMIGKDNPMTKKIEYKNKIYYGWRELKESTGVSKRLYTKYYLNGIDPEFRIGFSGPVPKNKG